MRRVSWILAFFLAMTGCSTTTRVPPPAPSPSVALEGTKWVLTGFGDHALKVPQKAWIRLENGRFEGFAGCNGLGGTYEVDGASIRFHPGPSTQLACDQIRGETLFRKRLRKVRSYRIAEGMLTMYEGERKLLVFLPE